MKLNVDLPDYKWKEILNHLRLHINESENVAILCNAIEMGNYDKSNSLEQDIYTFLISNKLQKKKNYYKTIGAEGFTNLLISYKGIGPWTVDMAKMFFLGDVDILPKEDLGIKRACNNFFPNETLESIEEIYKPFNSYLSLNLWDSLD